MGYQFVHIEVYSRKGTGGRGTGWVFDEAARDDACMPLPHIENPRPPEVVYGLSANEVRQLHDRMAAEATCVTAAGKTRKIRQDQNTLVTVVMSHPALVSDVEADPILAAQVAEWERRNLEWLQAEYGDQLVGLGRHTDEPHWHLHAFILPRSPDMRAADLHPGFAAKADTRARLEDEGADAQTIKKASNASYREAMKAFQGRYAEMVGEPSGLTRLGPGRRRLTRAGWQAEKIAAEAAARTAERVVEAETKIATAEAKIAETEAKILAAGRRLAKIEAKGKVTEERSQATRETSLEFLRKARKKMARAEKEAEQIIKDAESIRDRSRSLGGWFHGIIEGVKGVNVEEELARRLEDERAEIEDEAKRKVDRLRSELDFQKGLVAELQAKEIRQRLDLEAEIETRASLRAREIIQDWQQGPQNDAVQDNGF